LNCEPEHQKYGIRGDVETSYRARRIAVIAAEQLRHFRLKARDVRCSDSSDFSQSRRTISARRKINTELWQNYVVSRLIVSGSVIHARFLPLSPKPSPSERTQIDIFFKEKVK
jgi:hypothetical protein